MPREATGELRHLADGFAARITIEGRTRKDLFLPTCKTEPAAEERCRALAAIAVRLRRAGQADQILQVLEMGAKQRAGRPWDAVVQAVDVLCAGNARDTGAVEVPTLAEWGKQWVTGELAKKYPDHVRVKRSADRDEQLLRNYVLPHMDGVTVAAFTLAHAEVVMPALPPEMPPARGGSSRTRWLG
jgi:hypothetical protein